MSDTSQDLDDLISECVSFLIDCELKQLLEISAKRYEVQRYDLVSRSKDLPDLVVNHLGILFNMIEMFINDLEIVGPSTLTLLRTPFADTIHVSWSYQRDISSLGSDIDVVIQIECPVDLDSATASLSITSDSGVFNDIAHVGNFFDEDAPHHLLNAVGTIMNDTLIVMRGRFDDEQAIIIVDPPEEVRLLSKLLTHISPHISTSTKNGQNNADTK